jgi:hypothetical protein
MRNVMEEIDHERLLIGEIYLPVQQLVTYYGIDNRGAHLPFNFQLLSFALGRSTDSRRCGCLRRSPARDGLAQLGAEQS